MRPTIWTIASEEATGIRTLVSRNSYHLKNIVLFKYIKLPTKHKTGQSKIQDSFPLFSSEDSLHYEGSSRGAQR